MERGAKILLFLILSSIAMVVYIFGGLLYLIVTMLAVAGLWWLSDNREKVLVSFSGIQKPGKSDSGGIVTSRPKITFADVAGIDEAIDDITEISDFLKNPQKYTKLGARLPRGVLLIGPPGSGKTLLAKAIAGEARVPFDEVSASSFVNMLVGVGPNNVRDLFQKKGPRIIFIDEIDALGTRSDSDRQSSGDKEFDNTINEFLVQMDGFKENRGIIVIGATNRPNKLDPAILRPGRFDRRIVLNNPDLAGRIAIEKVHTKNKPLAPNVDLEQLAKRIVGFSGADIANMANEAAISAARTNKTEITNEDFERAIERMIVGIERKSKIFTKKEKSVIAYHESGHAIVALILGESPPTKISVIPRGMTLGMTIMELEEEQTNPDKKFLLKQIRIGLAGRAAEIIALDTETVGAKDDFEKATGLASAMVCQYGMSPMGMISYTKLASDRELGPSEETKKEKDAEIKRMISTPFEEVKQMLTDNRRALDAMAEALIREENLDKQRIEEIYRANKES